MLCAGKFSPPEYSSCVYRCLEITTAIEALTKLPYFQDSSNVVIYPLHSSLSSAEQTSIFQRPPNGKRKIVISTNIAETSKKIDQ